MSAEKDARAGLHAIWREAAEKGIEHGIDWPRVVLDLFRDLDRAEGRSVPVCECPTDDYCPKCHPRWYANWRARSGEAWTYEPEHAEDHGGADTFHHIVSGERHIAEVGTAADARLIVAAVNAYRPLPLGGPDA